MVAPRTMHLVHPILPCITAMTPMIEDKVRYRPGHCSTQSQPGSIPGSGLSRNEPSEAAPAQGAHRREAGGVHGEEDAQG